MSKKLEERDEAHADRIKALEKTLQEKECDWVTKNENLRRDLRTAIRSSIQDTEREVESIDNLEQVNVSSSLLSQNKSPLLLAANNSVSDILHLIAIV